MAMIIMNNPAAAMSLGEFNKNISQVSRRLREVSSGVKINGAGDDASGFAISERMRVRVRALGQDVQNVNTGRNMLRVAAGGVDSIVDNLRYLKEMAINAANDHNTDTDRQILQREFSYYLDNIDEIASNTEYNGMPLLDGRWGRFEGYWTDGSSGGSGSATFPPSSIPASYTPVSTGVAEPTGTAVALPADGNITTSGVYTIPEGFSGTINIADGITGGVKLTQASSAALSGVTINGPSGGNANLWLDGVNITGPSGASAIQFSGSGNVLSIKGDNTVEGGDSSKAVINVGGGLTVEGDGSLTGSAHNGAFIGTDYQDTTNAADITINSGTYNITTQGGGAAAGIGSGKNAGVGNITINGGTFTGGNPSSWGAFIGSGGDGGTPYATVKDITIANATIDCKAYDAAIGTGYWGIGGNITVSNSAIKAISTQGAAIGSGENGHVQAITITDSYLVVKKTGTAKDDIGAGASSATAGAVTITNTTKEYEDGGEEEPYWVDAADAPLVIHHGTKANEAIHCYILDMHTDALMTDIPDWSDIEELERYIPGSYRSAWEQNKSGADLANPQAAYDLLYKFVYTLAQMDTTYGKGEDYQSYLDYCKLLSDAKQTGLDHASIATRYDAEVSIRVIESALEYALDQSTTLGAYISRLDFTENNLTIANENTQASESAIRDADMARSMMEYTKSNILSQSAQSMLAQANQNASSVLSLLE